MKSLGRTLLRGAFVLAALAVAGLLWRGAVEGWIRRELMLLAASELNPALGIERIRYRFPSTVSLGNVRLTQLQGWPEDSAPEILLVDTVTLELASIPMPDAPFRIERITLSKPTLRLIPADDGFVGLSPLLEPDRMASRDADGPSGETRDYFGALQIDVEDGRAEGLRVDASPGWQQAGIEAELAIHPDGGGRIAVDLAILSPPEIARLARERDFAGQIATMLSRTTR